MGDDEAIDMYLSLIFWVLLVPLAASIFLMIFGGVIVEAIEPLMWH